MHTPQRAWILAILAGMTKSAIRRGFQPPCVPNIASHILQVNCRPARINATAPMFSRRCGSPDPALSECLA